MSTSYPRAGDFRCLVTIQKPDPASPRDAVGQRVTAWLDTATVYAKIAALSAQERFLAKQMQSDTTDKITIYYDSAVSAIGPDWRVKYGTRIFTVDGLPENVDERGVIIEMLCSEGPRTE